MLECCRLWIWGGVCGTNPPTCTKLLTFASRKSVPVRSYQLGPALWLVLFSKPLCRWIDFNNLVHCKSNLRNSSIWASNSLKNYAVIYSINQPRTYTENSLSPFRTVLCRSGNFCLISLKPSCSRRNFDCMLRRTNDDTAKFWELSCNNDHK